MTRDYEEPFVKELLTISEAAKFLRMPTRRVVNMGRRGWLTPVAHNGKLKYMGSEIVTLRAQLQK